MNKEIQRLIAPPAPPPLSLPQRVLYCHSEPHLSGRRSRAKPNGIPDVHVERSGSANLVRRALVLGARAVGYQRPQSYLSVAAAQQGGSLREHGMDF